jgi:HEAT repeat protein
MVPSAVAGADNGGVDADDLTPRIADLGARVNGHPENIDEVVPQLLALLEEHDDPRVIAQIIDALGCSWDEAANLAVLPYADHPDDAVRLAVTHAIPGGTDSPAGEQQVAEVLIRLSRDEVGEIRDWATFGLGSQLSIDTDEVRAALFARVNDSNEGARDEAVAGLARRRDGRAVELLRSLLSEDSVRSSLFGAAEYLADSRLCDVLLRWHNLDPHDESGTKALHACDPGYQQTRTEQHAALLAEVQRAFAEADIQSTAIMYCSRADVSVTLSIGDERGWDADALIRRAGGDVEWAARLVLSDLDARAD